ncbi:MAG: penicillin-binding protein 1B [Gammaproteobacteria bacterium]|nr:penicillin-binding protein 1B [Gammaproteobacteria bacterium]
MAKRKRTSRSRSVFRAIAGFLFKLTFYAGLLVTAVAAGYLIYLDRTITSTFEGRRWSVPAAVYAEPLELYPGAVLAPRDIVTELHRLGYQARGELDQPGTYQRSTNHLRIHLRSFQFMERNRSAEQIDITFGSYRVKAIEDSTGRPIVLIRLDPAMIGSFFPSHGEDRIVLAPEQVPDLLEETLKAVEDQNFDRHAGFDLRGIARAFWVNITSGELKQGGSTLTQQLVKSYFLDNRRTFGRKLNELAMAVILDARFSKVDLLNAYVNEIYIGQDGNRAVHGFGLGSQFFFNKPLIELNPGEIATLVAIIRGPSYYNPQRNPERALARRNLVLDKMLAHQLIDGVTHKRYKNSTLSVVTGNRRGGAYYPAFMDLVRSDLGDLFDEDDLRTNGLRIFTTLRPRTQDAVESGLSTALAAVERSRNLPRGGLQTAVVMTNTQTGELLAVAGGRKAGYDGFNRAINARRPVGSLLKPMVYLTALENGYHLASTIEDERVVLTMPDSDVWTPSNFDKRTHGPVPLVRALGDSLNLATVNLGLAIGVDTVARRMESLTGRAPINRYPSLLLGAESLTPIQVATIYGTFASGGFYMPPKAVIAVLDERGSPVSHHPFQLEQRIDPEIAQAMIRALEVVMQTGTGRTSRYARSGVAGKTGTSDDFRDSWFAGFDATTLTVAWVGYDDNSPTGLTGSAGALKIWDAIMTNLDVVPLAELSRANAVEIEYATGLVANAGCAQIVSVPIPKGSVLHSKPGCGINLRSLSNRLRSWLQND